MSAFEKQVESGCKYGNAALEKVRSDEARRVSCTFLLVCYLVVVHPFLPSFLCLTVIITYCLLLIQLDPTAAKAADAAAAAVAAAEAANAAEKAATEAEAVARQLRSEAAAEEATAAIELAEEQAHEAELAASEGEAEAEAGNDL